MNEEPEKVAREQPSYMARVQSASKSLIKDAGELNLPTVSVEFDNSLSSMIPKHGELLEGENGLGKWRRSHLEFQSKIVRNSHEASLITWSLAMQIFPRLYCTGYKKVGQL